MAVVYKKFFVVLFGAVFVSVLLAILYMLWPVSNDEQDSQHSAPLKLKTTSPMELPLNSPSAKHRDESCTFYSCLDIYRCGNNDLTRISVYVYPLQQFLDEHGEPLTLPISKEFYEILTAILDSPFSTDDPEAACFLVPSIDLLNQNNIRLKETSRVLASLPSWNDGSNHILFNMLPGSVPDYSTVLEVDCGKAIIAGGGFSTWSYRRTFDVSLPVYNPLVMDVKLPPKSYLDSRPWLLMSAQIGLHHEYRGVLAEMESYLKTDFLLLDKCENEEEEEGILQRTLNFSRRCKGTLKYDYPHVLQDATFCLVLRGARLGQTALSDALMTGCIPVVVADGYVLPFSEVLDWKMAAIIVREEELSGIWEIIQSVSMERIYKMRQQGALYWQRYFSTMTAITLTTLQILNDRVFPYAARSYEDWNEIPRKNAIKNPLFLPMIPPSSQGFTAVILTYDRLESLFDVIHQVAKVPSLAKVVVIWNNQQKHPPQMSAWPNIGKPLKVIQTHQNKLSNRFFPYDEIETECILALDDDIVMLTADELEFGYEVWREFSDRLIGFPSRVHLWDNGTSKWRYESEWTNAISMVLTGAAFYHKYFSFLYTYKMPGNIKAWVDEHMNCEDIAMNFLIANITGKAPIKVTPRKKFKCPECINKEMISADITHMVERSDCINQFASIYQSMPLKYVEFRADPVLYKDNFPSELKIFNDVGSL
ncbi:hypothetical protein CHS0354_021555 [Potamilus streckersoni]|uniref:Exostosin-2 n=1 Tax=Potamilus streckersoni TaxID=2493646 RepID=A0AAE0SPH4_9BIVA|nr:hypothetical protein CHS0354_021555 [Potamilus streckersoni]